MAMSEHALHDGIKLYGPALMRRLELVQELTVNAANMEEAPMVELGGFVGVLYIYIYVYI